MNGTEIRGAGTGDDAPGAEAAAVAPQAHTAGAKTAKYGRSSLIMTAGTIVSRMLGFVKLIVLAAAVGVVGSRTADSWDIANKLPTQIYVLIAGGVVNAVLVPQIIRASKREDGGVDYLNRLLTLAIGGLLVVTAVFVVIAGPVVRLYAHGWQPDQLALATAFAYWCLPQVFFFGLYTMLGQILNAKGSFGPYMWAPVVNNIVTIAGFGVFIWLFGPGGDGQHPVDSWDPAKIAIFAGGATLGVLCQALVLIIPLRGIGFRFTPTFGWRGVGLGTASRVAAWTFAAVLMGQLVFILVTRATTSATGSAGNSAYTYGQLIYILPHSLAAVSIATALFTPMSKYAADGDIDAVRDNLSAGLRTVGLITVFSTAAYMVLAGPISFALTNGRPADGAAVGMIVLSMVIGLVAYSANFLFQRVFYAFEDARTPFFTQIPVAVITAIGALIAIELPKEWVVVGVGIAISVANTVGVVITGTLLRRKLGSLDGDNVLRTHARLGLAALVAAAAGMLCLWPLTDFAWSGRLGAILSVVLVGGIMAVVYLVVCHLLRVREVREVFATITRRARG